MVIVTVEDVVRRLWRNRPYAGQVHDVRPNPKGDQPMKRRAQPLVCVGLLVLGTWLSLTACTRSQESGATTEKVPKESLMETVTPTMAQPAAVPPIDAAAPHTFETATFGLG